MTREQAWQIVSEYVQDPGLRRHMLAVEAAMGRYARRLDEEPQTWELVGLLHDFDWEIHPSLEDHPAKGAPILRERGLDETLVQAILAHNEAGTGVAPTRAIDFALLACDEVTGLLIASCLVRPDRDIRNLTIKSVKKKWKDARFAAGVDRAEIEQTTARFSEVCFDNQLELWEHVGNVLEAMQEAASTLELDGQA